MEKIKTDKKFKLPAYEEFMEMSRKKFPAKSKQEIIAMLEKNIVQFEEKYKMRSEEFVKRFDNGEFEERDDFPGHELFRWRSDYRSLLSLKSQKKKQ